MCQMNTDPMISSTGYLKITGPVMSLSIIGNEKSRRFFFHIRGGTLLPMVCFTTPSEAVIETQGSKVPHEDTLLSQMEQNSKGLFFISDVGWDFLLFYTEFL